MSQDQLRAKPAPDPHSKHDDDVLVVPKGSSRSRFVMTALLAVLVLTTFTVSDQVVDFFTGRGGRQGAFMTWTRPDGRAEEVSQSDFLMRKRNMSKAMSLLSGGAAGDHDDKMTAYHILNDQLAIDSGVSVTDAEMSEIILQSFGTKEIYRQRLAGMRMTAKEFEETLRSILRVRRHMAMLAKGFAEPDPKDVEQKWKEAHQEYSVQTVEVSTDAYAAEAEAACPAGPELQAWFDALSDVEKGLYRRPTEARVAGEFSWFSIDPYTSTDKLLAKYPRPATENADEVARTWYETNKDLLYVKPGLPPGKAREPADYKPFEEVAEDAKTAGIAYQSMLDWFNGLKLREEAGESFVLVEEGMSIGLAYRQEPDPKTLSEWLAAGYHFQGKAPVFALFNSTSQPGKLLPELFVDAKGLFVGRLVAREEARTPEFAEFEGEVREGWIKKKKGELAEAKLEELASKFPAEPDATNPAMLLRIEPDGAKFEAAAKELGLEVKTQDWLDVTTPVEPGKSTPHLQFVRTSATLYGKTVGTLSPPQLSPDGTAAWISRVAAKRDPDVARMTPQEYEVARRQAGSDAQSALYANTFFSESFLKEHYKLDLEAWRQEREQDAAPAN